MKLDLAEYFSVEEKTKTRPEEVRPFEVFSQIPTICFRFSQVL